MSNWLTATDTLFPQIESNINQNDFNINVTFKFNWGTSVSAPLSMAGSFLGVPLNLSVFNITQIDISFFDYYELTTVNDIGFPIFLNINPNNSGGIISLAGEHKIWMGISQNNASSNNTINYFYPFDNLFGIGEGQLTCLTDFIKLTPNLYMIDNDRSQFKSLDFNIVKPAGVSNVNFLNILVAISFPKNTPDILRVFYTNHPDFSGYISSANLLYSFEMIKIRGEIKKNNG